jgi:hypothetical protein
LRYFEVRRGKYTGQHKIYNDVVEAEADGIKNIKVPWYRPDVEIGDWCVADDGYVLQLLHKNTLINKRHISGQRTDYYRFCNGTFYVYYGKRGKRNIKNFYGNVAQSNKSSLSQSSSLGRYMNSKKKYFVTLLASGLDPYNAYAKAYKASMLYTKSAAYIWKQIDMLLSDELVRKELMNELKPTIKLLEDQIKQETGFATMQEWLVNELSTLLTKTKGLKPRDRRDNIRLLVTLFSEPLGFNSKKTTKEIDEAEWQLIPPPALSQNQYERDQQYERRINTDSSIASDSIDNTNPDVTKISSIPKEST